jgi:hypothetical protein
MANNFTFDNKDAATAGEGLYLGLIRQLLFQASFSGTLHTFARRIFRFHRIYESALALCTKDTRATLDQLIKEDTGLTFSELMALIPAINVCWMQIKKFDQDPRISPASIKEDNLREQLVILMDRLSLDMAGYAKTISEIKNKRGELFFLHVDASKTLVRYPFLKNSSGAFLLLGPHLLLRRIELAVVTAFIDKRDRDNMPVQTLYGPLGDAFEKHCHYLFRRKIPHSKDIPSLYVENPKLDSGNELCDALIEDPDCFVIFEIKYRPPSTDAINPLDSSYKELKRWLNATFLKSREECKQDRESGQTPGALVQLDEAACNLAMGKWRIKPRVIIPVVVLSEAIISSLPLYFYLDKKSEERGLFRNAEGVQPFLIISEDELSYLTSMNATNCRFAFHQLFKEKSTAEGARITSWSHFADVVKLKWEPPKDQEEDFNQIIEETKKLFEKKS